MTVTTIYGNGLFRVEFGLPSTVVGLIHVDMWDVSTRHFGFTDDTRFTRNTPLPNDLPPFKAIVPQFVADFYGFFTLDSAIFTLF